MRLLGMAALALPLAGCATRTTLVHRETGETKACSFETTDWGSGWFGFYPIGTAVGGLLVLAESVNDLVRGAQYRAQARCTEVAG